MKHAAAFLALLVLAGCGSTVPTHSAAPSGQASASAARSAPTGELLFAVSQGTCGLGCTGTVAIVDVGGRTRAKATFKPPTPPMVGCEGSFLIASAQVAAGSVYYLDDTGTVRRLRPSGDTQVVARFPILTSQQITWFAVSPDGNKFMASLVAFPPLVSPTISPSQGCPEHVPGDVRQRLVVATVGGGTTTILDQSLGSTQKGPPPHLLAVVGWDNLGPVANTDAHMAYIGYIEGTVWLGQAAAHLDASGRAGPQLGGSGCIPYFGDLPDGKLVCYDPKHPTVRDASGRVLWRLKPLDPSDNFTYGNISLSPDASHVAFSLDSNCCYTFDSSVIRSRDGVRIGLGSTFQPQGWLENTTVVGVKGLVKSTCSGCPPDFVPGNMALVRLATPTTVTDLGFQGRFLGVVSGSSV